MAPVGCVLRRSAVALCGMIAVALVSIAAPAAGADDDANFYRGKQITFIVGSGAGGVYDVSARVLAPFLTAHIPGNPKIVIENMPGASGMKSAAYMATAAPRDGTVIDLPLASVGTAQLLTPSGANFDPTKFLLLVSGIVGPVPWGQAQVWTEGDTYLVGPPASLVTNAGGLYVCTTAHVAGASFDPTKWTALIEPFATSMLTWIAGLPTTLPAASGVPWIDGGVLEVSQ